MQSDPPDLSRLSLNQISTNKHTLQEAVEACSRHGIRWLGAWRHKIQESPAAAGKLIRDAGLRVSSLCRGGMFPAASPSERRERIDDNFRAIDEAVALGTDLLVLVNGAAPDRDLDGARVMVAKGIAAIQSYARQCGVRLGIEPLHPMFAGDRSVIVTLEQANDLAAAFDPQWVGVIIDVYHVWWDPNVYKQISRCGKRIFGFHVSDWLVPSPGMLMGRGLMGQGVIEINRLRRAVEAAGFDGPIEVEIFNEQLWQTPIDDALRLIQEAYLRFV
jgi:sugar phosphate isomerase/epimerase